MHWGECSMFRCRQDYAYGKDGFKGVIPPSATLDFYVELVGWEPELRWCTACEALFEGPQCLKQDPDEGCDPLRTGGKYKLKIPNERIKGYWKEVPMDATRTRLNTTRHVAPDGQVTRTYWYNYATSSSLAGAPENVHDQEEQRWLGEPPPLQPDGKKKDVSPAAAGGGGGAASAALAALGGGSKKSSGGFGNVAAGLTTLKAVTKLKRAITPYYLQYNPKFETSNAKERRQELRSHPQVRS